MAGWKPVKLGDVLVAANRGESVEATKEYRLLGVRLEGRGPFIRETVLGSQSSASRLFRVEAGDFIYSRLFACRGAFGVIDESTHGCFVSGEFPIYQPVPGRIDVQFLRYWFTLPPVIARVDEDCTGSTPLTRNRFKENFFLALEIPLPPLTEQRRIVARIDALAAEIAEAKRLRQEAVAQAEVMCRAIITQDADSKLTPMSDLVRMRPSDVTVQSDETYQFAGVYCFGRGVFRSVTKTGMEFAYPRLTRLRKGNFVYPKLMAWEGALGVVPEECDGMVVSTEFPVFEVLTDRVFPEVLDTHFKNPSVWPDLSGSSTGTNVRRRRLNPCDFLKYRFPLPPRSTQETLRKVKAGVNAMNHLQSATAAELDALLPAILDRAFKGNL